MLYILFLLCMAYSSSATESYSEPSKNQSTCLTQQQKDDRPKKGFWDVFLSSPMTVL